MCAYLPVWEYETSAVVRNSWGYTQSNVYKKADAIICEMMSKNGALLLNMWSKSDGIIPEKEASILEEGGA